jgi:hypothetical protein
MIRPIRFATVADLGLVLCPRKDPRTITLRFSSHTSNRAIGVLRDEPGLKTRLCKDTRGNSRARRERWGGWGVYVTRTGAPLWESRTVALAVPAPDRVRRGRGTAGGMVFTAVGGRFEITLKKFVVRGENRCHRGLWYRIRAIR